MDKFSNDGRANNLITKTNLDFITLLKLKVQSCRLSKLNETKVFTKVFFLFFIIIVYNNHFHKTKIQQKINI